MFYVTFACEDGPVQAQTIILGLYSVQSPLPTCFVREATQSDDKDFFDVTLACDDGRVQANKLILGLCSPLFQHVLPEKQPRERIKIFSILLSLPAN